MPCREQPPDMHDAIIIGGGFYGAAIAVYLTARRGFRSVVLIERERELMTRASHNNQARIHNGYHYPRSFTTAYRSRVNFSRFVRDYAFAVKSDFTKVYGIARRNSKVTAKQFGRFCRDIGAKFGPAPVSISSLFEPRLIEEVLVVEEYVFDAVRLADWAREALSAAGVDVRLETRATEIKQPQGANRLDVTCVGAGHESESILGRYVFNCTYSAINHLGGDFPGTKTRLKHEITEMALLEVPPALSSLGVTVMDGPFFSMMPFPSRGLHSLSHVRYTPHRSWFDENALEPHDQMRSYSRTSHSNRMLRDVARYLPAVSKARYVESLFEIKTVLVKNEADDGRPILFERYPELPNCFSILGGKIDNIYDVLEKLDAESFSTR